MYKFGYDSLFTFFKNAYKQGAEDKEPYNEEKVKTIFEKLIKQLFG